MNKFKKIKFFRRNWQAEIHHIKAMKKIKTIEFFNMLIFDNQGFFDAIDHLSNQIQTLVLKDVRIDSSSFAKLVKMMFHVIDDIWRWKLIWFIKFAENNLKIKAIQENLSQLQKDKKWFKIL